MPLANLKHLQIQMIKKFCARLMDLVGAAGMLLLLEAHSNLSVACQLVNPKHISNFQHTIIAY